MDLSGPQGELPIPIPTHTSYSHTHANVHAHANIHNHSLLHDHHHTTTVTANGPPPQQHHHHKLPSPPLAPEDITPISTPRKRNDNPVKYRECLKNHAAAIGGNATDGCGEFMPSGEDGTLEALKCSACSCHRNFHRKELEGEPAAHQLHTSSCTAVARRVMGQLGHKGLLVSAPTDPFARALPAPPLTHAQHNHHMNMIMPLSAMQTSESDEMEVMGGCGGMRPPMLKKRFRTRFTPEQKEKMLDFAEKVGWRMQKLEDGVVQQFCQEIGVKRRVLKVWMHNNKHNLAKKSSSSPMQLESK